LCTQWKALPVANVVSRPGFVPDEIPGAVPDAARNGPDYHDFFQNAPLALRWLSLDGTILNANEAELALLGYTVGEYVGRPLAQFLADGEPAAADLLERLRDEGTLSDYPTSMKCNDGSIRDVVLDANIAMRDGRPVGACCVTRDERSESNAAYHLSAIVQSSDDAIASKDLDGIVLSWNPGAERLFGYTADEMIGRSIRTIIPAGQQAEEDDVLRHVRRGERVEHFETIRRRKDGSLVPISLTVSPIRDRRGRIIGASKIARDISERRLAEEAMRSSMALKDQFLGLVSHELRTPISTIVGNSQLLLRRGERLPAEARIQALTDIEAEGERLQRVVENLLVLTRLEATGTVTAGEVDMRGVLTEVVAAMRRRMPGREISLEIRDSVRAAAGDPMLVTLILQNLLSNADKYSPGDAPIEVVLTARDGSPDIHVLDRGIGIDPADVERVFEPFYRSPAGIARASGMGLGLTVCRRLAEALGGGIHVQERAGGGSDFTLRLPAFAEVTEPEAARTEHASHD
jgi:PAS domain S-box-containing protein